MAFPDDLGARDLTVPVDGMLVRAHVFGAGPPLVLVHGLGTSSESYRDNVACLSAFATVYAVDLPGFGRSDDPRELLAPDHLATVLARWCLAMDIQKASFLGHSVGGEVCLWLAANYPTMVDRLILAGTPGLRTTPIWRRIVGLMQDGAREPVAYLPTIWRGYARAGLWRMVATARASDPVRLLAQLGRVHAPTLVLWGANDPVVTLEEARHMASRIPHARLEVIPEGAHGLIFDAPDAVNRAVSSFMHLSPGALTPAEVGPTEIAPDPS